MLVRTKSVDHIYVVDRLADTALSHEVLAANVAEFQSGQWELLDCSVTEIRKQRKKRIVFGVMSYRDTLTKRTHTEQIVAKVYGSDRGTKAFDALQQLWQAGFRAPAKHRVTRPFGYVPAGGILLQQPAQGRTWAASLEDDRATRATDAHQAAAWLSRLHRTPVPVAAVPGDHYAAHAQRHVDELIDMFGERSSALNGLAARLLPALQTPNVPLVTTHGDYHPMNVFVTPTLTTVIDFDTCARREAAYDVGYAIGQLLIMSYMKHADLAAGADAAATFWQRYRRDGAAPWPRVATQIARTLLQSLHYELCTLRNGRLDLLRLWPSLMEHALRSTSADFFDAVASA